MPLQIRRGTNAERAAMTQPLAAGELLYTTDTQRLYIGNANTLGGVQVTGYTDTDAKDAAASIFTSGTHSGINFSYNTTTDVMNVTVDLTSYSGSINAASLKGSIFADDSSLMVDTIDNKIYASNGLYGNVTGNVTGNLSGNVTGNVNGNVTGTVTGNLIGNSVGYHTGDVKGSVFGDDSSAIINADTNTVSASNLVISPYLNIAGTSAFPNASPSITNTNPFSNVIIFDGASIDVLTNTGVDQPGVSITGISTGTNTTSITSFYGSRGTTASPTTLNNGDNFSGFFLLGHNGTDYVPGVAMFGQVNAVPNSANPSIAGKFVITVADGTNDIFAVNKQATFDSAGTFTAPVLKTGVYTSAPDTRPTGSKGMIIYDDSTGKFQGYNGAVWVDLN